MEKFGDLTSSRNSFSGPADQSCPVRGPLGAYPLGYSKRRQIFATNLSRMALDYALGQW